jgi:hypothetical protein
MAGLPKNRFVTTGPGFYPAPFFPPSFQQLPKIGVLTNVVYFRKKGCFHGTHFPPNMVYLSHSAILASDTFFNILK